jgi:UDPglucose--hexose-1-phosphate uridylyltransferase
VTEDSIGQLRWNPLAHRWVAVAGHRSERPVDEPPVAAEPERPVHDPNCPFCPGNEHETLPAVATLPIGAEPDGPWQLRVVPNKYPSFAGAEPVADSPRETAAASGACEVVIFTPDHHRDLADCSPDQAAALLSVIADRCRAHADLPAVKHTSIIVNRGRTSGASLTHPHAQLLSTPFVPPTVRVELDAFAAAPDVLSTAVDRFPKGMVARRDGALSVCPPWAGFPYETWVVPIDRTRSITDASDAELVDVGALLVDLLGRLRRSLGDVDYNVAFRVPPPRTKGPFAWHLQILPRHVPLAGFELSAGVAVNATPAEVAADHLRSASS